MNNLQPCDSTFIKHRLCIFQLTVSVISATDINKWEVVRGSSVGTAARYGLDGRGSNPGRGARFSTPAQSGRRAHPASCTMGTGSLPGLKRPGRGVDHPPSSSAEVKRKSGATPLLPLWAVVACSRATFTFYFYLYRYKQL